MPPKNAYNNQYHTLHDKKMGVFVSFNEQGGHNLFGFGFHYSLSPSWH